MKIRALLESFYGPKYKYYMILPAVLFFVFAFLVFVSPGIQQGIDLKGGTLVVIGTDAQANGPELESLILSEFALAELKVIPFQGGVQVQYGANIVLDEAKAQIESARAQRESNPEQSLASCSAALETLSVFLEPGQPDFADAQECIAFAEGFFGDASDAFDEKLDSLIISKVGAENAGEGRFRRTEISPALGSLFWSSAQLIMAIALVSVVVVIFIFFREVVPSIAVILAIAFDILAALALMSVFGIPFSLASISSLLMLVGYSVDTDIMLTTRLLKRKYKTTRENAADCLVTGLTMTGTTLGAVTVMLVLSSVWNLEVIFSIAIVLIFGLLGDLISTWFMNAPLLMLYLERKGKK